MQDEHRPPEEIYLDDEALAEHFEHVKRTIRSGGSQTGSSDAEWEAIPEAQNELTKHIRRK